MSQVKNECRVSDAGGYALGMNSPYNKKGSHNVNVGVDWLRGRYARGGFMSGTLIMNK